MLALLSVWLGMISLFLSLLMLVYRPAFTDGAVTMVLWFGAPGAMCFAGLTLWAYRDDGRDDLGIVARRIQAKAAIGMGVVAAAIVYALIILSTKLEPVARSSKIRYNSRVAEVALTTAEQTPSRFGEGPSTPPGVPKSAPRRWEWSNACLA